MDVTGLDLVFSGAEKTDADAVRRKKSEEAFIGALFRFSASKLHFGF
jgi:hypothetical protein